MFRVGIGYDIHAFAAGRKLVLGGVEIPFDRGLKGHSDADALLHAVMDALLGAASLADIGHYFPTGAVKYKDISSLKLLEEVMGLLKDKGWQVVNVDSVIIAQKPTLSPYLEQMKQNIGRKTGIASDRIGIKATTAEGLGSLGRVEGIAAYAVAMVERS